MIRRSWLRAAFGGGKTFSHGLDPSRTLSVHCSILGHIGFAPELAPSSSRTTDGCGSFSEGGGPCQRDPEGESAERPEQAEIEKRLDVVDPAGSCDVTVDGRRH